MLKQNRQPDNRIFEKKNMFVKHYSADESLSSKRG